MSNKKNTSQFLCAFGASFFLGTFIAQANPKETHSERSHCLVSKEFSTAYEYLKKPEVSQLDLEAREKKAIEIARGCEGATGRFIKIFDLLTKAGFAPKDAEPTAMSLSTSSDAHVEVFRKIFAYSFSEEGLDLDLSQSLDLTRKLTLNLTLADLKSSDALKTYMNILEFCSSQKDLGLPPSDCATFSGKIFRLESASSRTAWIKNRGKSFEKGIQLLTQSHDDEPSLTTADALKIAEGLMERGPDSFLDFVQTFKYAKTSLGKNRNDALLFAKKLFKLP